MAALEQAIQDIDRPQLADRCPMQSIPGFDPFLPVAAGGFRARLPTARSAARWTSHGTGPS
jgi:hypothetical protein